MRLAVADVVEGVVLEANQQRALPAFGPAGRASQGMMLVTYMDHPLWFFIFFSSINSRRRPVARDHGVA